MTGVVYLVGSGPGDPNLLTRRGFDLIQLADVVLYDRLVSKEIISLIPKQTKKIYVGRSVGDDYCHQEQYTNKLMLKYAQIKKHIVRLKGGDPMIFGRGGEEAEYLKNHMIKFEIVPGISSGIGVPTYSGIPLTHRKMSSSLAFVTGNETPYKRNKIDWKKLANCVDTIVIFMGLSKLESICKQFIDGGMNKNMPIAVIQHGTMKNHKTTLGKISTISDQIKNLDVEPPVIIVIGDVVNLSKIISQCEIHGT
ncbi:MAG: uroporphyrinogen-III C-methyltransferase [Nitrosopumilaceae archaeon]|nr:uroporphyrinogen-III C-methyltransferase [Nitrosopumilaceae archaeon]